MKISAIILLIGVVVIFALWMKGLSSAIAKESLKEAAAQKKKILMKGALLFIGLVVLNLAAGISGVFSRFDRFPPPFALFFVFNILLLPSYLTFSRFGELLAKHTSERMLVGFQSFRLLAELLIFFALLEGVAPIQISLRGYNPDIYTAVFSIGLFFWLKRRSAPQLTLLFNIWGMVALLVIGFIAVTSMPGPLRLFPDEPSNIWVTTAPYTLLPGILVSAALTGHFLYFRKLVFQKRNSQSA